MVSDLLLPQFALQCGASVQNLRLGYEVHGELNAARDNAVLFPTWFGGRHDSNRWIIGPGRALDPARHCLVVVDALGNGESSSPSNHAGLANHGKPLPISLLDNVQAQLALMDSLGVDQWQAVVGRSMGAQHALQWACLHPGRVGRVFAFCGLPRTTPHNRVMLRSMIGVLEDGVRGGRGEQGLRLAAGIYAAWTLSHAFFNHERWRASAESEADWIERNVRAGFARFHPLDLLALARTWELADVSDNPVFGGDLRRALQAITAPVLLMPISHDLIFPVQDFAPVQQHIRHATLQALSSEWGHRAGAPGSPHQDVQALEAALRGFLAAP